MSLREPALDERVVLLAEAFAGAELPFAFGGALAAAYYAEPRATVDIDVNVFVEVEKTPNVLDAVRTLGVDVTERSQRRLVENGQARLRWGRYPLDVFLSSHPFHDAAAVRVRRVPFGDSEIPILSCEDLVVFKAMFDRVKDWLDIEQILFASPSFDVGYVEHWLHELIGSDDRRTVRFAHALRNASGRDS